MSTPKFIVQFAGATRCAKLLYGTSVTSGVDYPNDAACVAFIAHNGDQTVSNYKIAAGVLKYIGGGVDVVPFNHALFRALCAADTGIPLSAMRDVTVCADLARDTSFDAAKAYFVRAKSGVAQGIVDAIKAHAVTAGMPVE